jgi:hypothetical protein
VPEPLEEYLSEAQERAADERAWNEWVGAMPDALRSLPDSAWQRVMQKRDLFPLLAALAKACPDAGERARTLFAWHGHGGIAWSGFPSYESLPAALLAQFPEKDLVRLCESSELDPAQALGAARFFACNDPARAPSLPSELGPSGEVLTIPRRSSPAPAMSAGLRAKFLSACVFGTNDEGRVRAEAAFLEADDRAFVAAVRAARALPLLVLPSPAPMRQAAAPEALARFLSEVDAMVPPDLPLVLEFQATPPAKVDVSFQVREEDQARLADLRAAFSRLPEMRNAAGGLTFTTWYGR